MNATQLNVMALLIILAFAALGVLVVAILSSRSLRERGVKQLVKRWFG